MKRAVGYIRESTEEQGQNWAPHVQRKAIEAYAREKEWELVGLYEDFVSGRAADKRPDFQRLLRDAAEQRFDVVLVYHSSRFARNVGEARRYKEHLRRRLNVDVVSVTQNFGEQDDPAAFLMEGLNEVLDEHYSRNLGFLISAGLQEKVAQGYMAGALPFGYRRPPGDSRNAVPDPEEARVIKLAFERYARGTLSYTALADWLNAQGHRGRRGRVFTKWSIEEMLRNVTYAGYVGGYRAPLEDSKPGKHDAIVSLELFRRVEAVRQSRWIRKHGTRPSRRVYVLSGTAICGRCGATLYGSRGGNNGHTRYLCSTRVRRRSCDQPQALAEPIESELSDFLSDLRLREGDVAAVVAELRDRLAIKSGQPKGQRADELQARLARLRDLYELGDISRAEYLRRKAKATALMPEKKPVQTVDFERCVALLRDFQGLWENETDAREKQQFVGLAFEAIVVDNKRITAVRPRPEVLPLFVERSGVREDRGAGGGNGARQGAHSRGDWI